MQRDYGKADEQTLNIITVNTEGLGLLKKNGGKESRGIRRGATAEIERGGWFDEVVPPAVCKCENVVFHERNF